MATRVRFGATGVIVPLMVVLAILSLPFLTFARPASTGYPLRGRQEDDDDDIDQNPNGATVPFTDPVTGIQYQRFFGAKTTFAFGISLPQSPNNSFIGLMDIPLNNGAGYGALSLQGRMDGPLMLAAWTPDGTTIQTSFRQAPDEDSNPPEVTGAFSVRMIQAGTRINNTRITMTFLCEGCIGAGLGLDAAQTAGTAEMGWALSNRAVGAGSGARLGFHNAGFGAFSAALGQARFAEFDIWVAMADAVTSTAPVNGARPFAPRRSGNGNNRDSDSGDESGDE